MDEQIAISPIKQGDLIGLDFLVNRYQVQAVHAAYLVVYDRLLAEDIAQSAFVKLAERIDQFDKERPFAPRFFRIILNDAIKATKRQRQMIPLDQSQDDLTRKLAAWPTDPTFQPWQLVEQKETRLLIFQAIQSLSPEQRAVIVMRYFLELSEADMSEKMDRPLAALCI